MMEERDDLHKQDPASPRLSTVNDEITKATSDYKRRPWKEFVESIDHRSDITTPSCGGRSKELTENPCRFHRKTPHLTQADRQQLYIYIYHSESHFLTLRMPFFLKISLFLYTFPFCKYTLHVCYIFNVNLTDSFDDRRSQCRLI